MRNQVSKLSLLAAMTLSLLAGDTLAGTAEAQVRRQPVPRSVTARRSVRPARASRSYVRARPRAVRAPRPQAAPTPEAFAALRNCESRSRYDINTGNGFYGAYQFLPSTWRSLGYGGMPHEATLEVQDEAARRLQARSGWGQWPACTRRLGLR